MQSYLDQIAQALVDLPVTPHFNRPVDGQSPPVLEIAVDASRLGRSAFEVCRRLRQGSPPVYVGHGRLDHGRLVVHPLHLDRSRTTTLIRRLREELAAN